MLAVNIAEWVDHNECAIAYFSCFFLQKRYEYITIFLRRSCAIIIRQSLWVLVNGHDVVPLRRGWKIYVRSNTYVARRRCWSLGIPNTWWYRTKHAHTNAHMHTQIYKYGDMCVWVSSIQINIYTWVRGVSSTVKNRSCLNGLTIVTNMWYHSVGFWRIDHNKYLVVSSSNLYFRQFTVYMITDTK